MRERQWTGVTPPRVIAYTVAVFVAVLGVGSVAPGVVPHMFTESQSAAIREDRAAAAPDYPLAQAPRPRQGPEAVQVPEPVEPMSSIEQVADDGPTDPAEPTSDEPVEESGSSTTIPTPPPTSSEPGETTEPVAPPPSEDPDQTPPPPQPEEPPEEGPAPPEEGTPPSGLLPVVGGVVEKITDPLLGR